MNKNNEFVLVARLINSMEIEEETIIPLYGSNYMRIPLEVDRSINNEMSR